jgi:hypothetical protein
MLTMLTDVTNTLKAHGIGYMVTFGTLLGGHRDKQIIPWTADVDIYTSEEGKAVLSGSSGTGYKFFVDGAPTVLRGCPDREGNPALKFNNGKIDSPANDQGGNLFYYLDIYGPSFFTSQDPKWMPCSEGPPSTVTIAGKQFATVKDPDACLRSAFGADYMTPKATNHNDKSLSADGMYDGNHNLAVSGATQSKNVTREAADFWKAQRGRKVKETERILRKVTGYRAGWALPSGAVPH